MQHPELQQQQAGSKGAYRDAAGATLADGSAPLEFHSRIISASSAQRK